MRLIFPRAVSSLALGRGGQPVLDLSFSNVLPPGFTFTRSSTAKYYDAAGVQQTAAINVPRFDHDPTTHAPLGLLLEGADAGSGRAAEYLTLALPSGGFPGATGLTVELEFAPTALPGNAAAMGVSGASGVADGAFLLVASNGTVQAAKSVGGFVVTSTATPDTLAIGVPSKVAVSMDSEAAMTSLEGGGVAAAEMPGYPVMTSLSIGRAVGI